MDMASSSDPSLSPCVACGLPTPLACASCLQTPMCSSSCSAQAWQVHRAACDGAQPPPDEAPPPALREAPAEPRRLPLVWRLLSAFWRWPWAGGAGAGDLPPGWTRLTSRSSGKPYYSHASSGACVWQRPAAPGAPAPPAGADAGALAAAQQGLLPGWVAVWSSARCDVFWQQEDGRVTWVKPGRSAAAAALAAAPARPARSGAAPGASHPERAVRGHESSDMAASI